MERMAYWGLLLSLLTASGAWAEEGGTIRGTVYISGKEPLPEAQVIVDGTSLTATTNAAGQFEIPNVPPAKYALKISAPGYLDATQTVEVVASQAASIEADLTLDERFGEEIVVTGSKFGEKRLESPATVETVSAKTVQMIGGTSHLDALSSLKGVDFAEHGVNEKQISLRGFNGHFTSRLLAMVDGRLAQVPGAGVPQSTQLPTPPLDIKSIDVVLGPASALYGPNAHSGVVNVITKSPWDEPGVSMALRGGALSLLDGSVRAAGTVSKNFGFKINGQFARGKDFAPSRDQASHYFGTSRAPLIFEGDLVDDYHFRSAKAEAFLYYRLGDWDFKGGYGFSTKDGLVLTPIDRYYWRGRQLHYQTLSATHRNWFAQVTRSSGDAGGTYAVDRLASAVQANGGAPDDPTTLEPIRQQIKIIDESQHIDSELQYRNTLGELQLLTGVQLRVYQPNSKGSYLSDGDGKTLSTTELGGYVQGDYGLLRDKLRLVGALRFDTHTTYSSQLSPKAAVVYSPASAQHLRVSYNRAYKSPTILESYALINNILVGNRTGFTIRDASGNVLSEIKPLVPEQVDTVELGYKAAFSNQLLVDVVAHHSWYKNFISPQSLRANPFAGTFGFYADGTPVAEGTPLQGLLITYSNFGRSRVAGADLGIGYRFTPEVSFDGSISYIKLLSFRNADPAVPSLLLNVPELKFKAALTVQHWPLPRAFLRLASRHQTAYPFSVGRWDSRLFFRNGKIPARFVADLSLGYTFSNDLALSGYVTNLFNDKRIDVLGAPQGGRLAYLQLAYKYDGLNF
jgi:iron complex outermembrane receptor protein